MLIYFKAYSRFCIKELGQRCVYRTEHVMFSLINALNNLHQTEQTVVYKWIKIDKWIQIFKIAKIFNKVRKVKHEK